MISLTNDSNCKQNSIETLVAINNIPNLDKEVENLMFQEYYDEQLEMYQEYQKLKESSQTESCMMFEVKFPTREDFERCSHMLGSCHWWWSAKKRLLKEKYGIDWLTPSECNPNVRFD